MEISEYLRVLKRRLVVLIIPVVAAAGIAFASYVLEPQAYQAQVTLTIPPVDTARDVDQMMENYLAAARTPVVLNEVSQATSVRMDRLVRDLSLSRIGGSSFVAVSFVSTDPEEARAVVEAAGRATNAFLFGQRLENAEARVAEAERIHQDAEVRIKDLLEEVGGGVVSLTDLFNQRQSELSALRLSRIQAAARGEAGYVAGLDQAIEEREQELRDLGPLVVEFNRLAADRDSAYAALDQARTALAATEEQLDESNGEVGLTGPVSPALPVPRPFVRRVLSAAGAGLFFAIGLIALLEFVPVRPRKPGSKAQDDASVGAETPSGAVGPADESVSVSSAGDRAG